MSIALKLRELQEAFDEGLLNDQEHGDARKCVLAAFTNSSSDQSNSSFDSSMQRVSTVLESIVTCMSDSTASKRARSSDVPIVYRTPPPPNAKKACTVVPSPSRLAQSSVLHAFQKAGTPINISVRTAAGRVLSNLSPASLEPTSTSSSSIRYCCDVCAFKTSKAQALTNHKKTHVLNSELSPMHPFFASLSSRAMAASIEVQAKLIISDIIRSALTQVELSETHWTLPTQMDGRKKNHGASRRQRRSYEFKYTLILEYERILAQHALGDQTSQVVADIYSVSRNQVTDWVRDKDKIIAAMKNPKYRKNSRVRKKKGRFHLCEKALHKSFLLQRKKGRGIGPQWIRQSMLKQVRDKKPDGWRLFSARRGWLARFAKRFNLCLRRKTNCKRVPIEVRVPHLKRWFAVFRQHLLSFKGKKGYDDQWSIYPPENRWSVDQVPAGLFDPTSTYETKGADFVHIASNGSADGHRICTLQVLCRNIAKSNKPRGGQPRMVICFKGLGVRISADERSQYHKDVYVMFQKKAWYDGATCNKWVVEVAMQDIPKRDATNGKRHLILCDNLGGQTKLQNPQFAKLCDKHSHADVWNLLAGNTDEIQVVDAGLGAYVKRHAEGVMNEWLAVEENWQEWAEKGCLSASRKRILLTQWYGEAWQRACEGFETETQNWAAFDFQGVFTKCGSNLTADGTNDDLIKLQKLDEFTFCAEDAKRDATTGTLPSSLTDTTDHVTPADSNDAAVEACEDRFSGEELVVNEPAAATAGTEEEGDIVDDGGDTTDEGELEGADFACPENVEVYDKLPANVELAKMKVYCRYDVGWFCGKVIRAITSSLRVRENGHYAIMFDDSATENRDHKLMVEDYGADGHWVLVK